MSDDEVPRGTPKAMRFQAPLEQAIFYGYKTETRRPLTRGNCLLNRGRFEDLDLASGRPEHLYPVASLRCRISTEGGERRSVTVQPRIRPNSWLWPRVGQQGAASKLQNARVKMRVVSVHAVRLCDLSELQARREGIWIYAPTCLPEMSLTASEADVMAPRFACEAYEFLLDHLGKKRATMWRRGTVHQDIVGRDPTARDAFALLWESINGPGSWQQNPWVWRYEFVSEPFDGMLP